MPYKPQVENSSDQSPYIFSEQSRRIVASGRQEQQQGKAIIRKEPRTMKLTRHRSSTSREFQPLRSKDPGVKVGGQVDVTVSQAVNRTG